MTDAERKMWYKLRNRQLINLKFRRQAPFGPYFLDFYCPQKQIAIEIDGGQHYSIKGCYRDKIREKYLKKSGLRILRYSNSDILNNLDGVLHDILRQLQINNSSPYPSPQRGEGILLSKGVV
ncbi:hypothetical protein AMJ52_03010 [candidate division TA06 bacterium DG_78]|uniref:DUF559 domain-containing protein n=1 Tax=candidate division TA06 bacterium DG_78 TaxID=1703772 RepID=A0A0S7YGN7_UNCT6|nr:MAG: hypothetical protein AMJ52_03010 [candidate division TA06 bacterium DG_78]